MTNITPSIRAALKVMSLPYGVGRALMQDQLTAQLIGWLSNLSEPFYQLLSHSNPFTYLWPQKSQSKQHINWRDETAS